jgi:hypothetical protein
MHNAYIAGLFDGEGCINIYHHIKWYQLRIIIQMTTKKPLDELYSRYGGVLRFVESKNPKWSPTWRWEISDKDMCIRFIEDILPYSIIKLPQCEVALEFLATIQHHSGVATPDEVVEKRRTLMEKIKVIKHDYDY